MLNIFKKIVGLGKRKKGEHQPLLPAHSSAVASKKTDSLESIDWYSREAWKYNFTYIGLGDRQTAETILSRKILKNDSLFICVFRLSRLGEEDGPLKLVCSYQGATRLHHHVEETLREVLENPSERPGILQQIRDQQFLESDVLEELAATDLSGELSERMSIAWEVVKCYMETTASDLAKKLQKEPQSQIPPEQTIDPNDSMTLPGPR